MEKAFRRFADITAEAVGSPWAFILATLSVIIWAVTGPLFHYSDTWQLVINTGTTVLTFLIVFVIQHSQNRDSAGIRLKLDELIHATEGARNSLMDLDSLSTAQLKELEAEYKRICNGAEECSSGIRSEDLEAQNQAA
jgi:low affinity Fe/Cu permease